MPDHFQLTYRPEDLREICKEELQYTFFKEKNYSPLFLGILFLVLAIIFLPRPMDAKSCAVLAICIAAGWGYQVYRLLKDYGQFKASKKEVEEWIAHNATFAHHAIVVGEDSFHYKRDVEVFEYTFRNFEEHSITELYFSCVDRNQGNIVLPRKSFEEGEFERFLETINARLKPDGH